MFEHLYDRIKRHAEREVPKESCGIIVDDEYIECRNISDNPTKSFVIPAEQYLPFLISKRLQAVIHSHTDGSDFPSYLDMKQQIELGVPFGISIVNNRQASNPIWFGDGTPIAPLLGRIFKHGVADCYALVRDYFKLKRGIVLKNFPRSNEWWNKGGNLLATQFRDAGFIEVDKKDLVKDDCFLSRVVGPVICHCGVYTGDGKILHHLTNRPSRYDLLGLWSKKITHYLRYVG